MSTTLSSKKIYKVNQNNGALEFDADELPLVGKRIRVILTDQYAEKYSVDPIRWVKGTVEQIGSTFQFISDDKKIVDSTNAISCYIYDQDTEKS